MNLWNITPQTGNTKGLYTIMEYQSLIKNGMPRNCEYDHVPVIKLLCTKKNQIFLLSMLDPQNPQIAFGLSNYDHDTPSIGYFDLNKIIEVKKKFGREIEPDHTFKPHYRLSVYAAVSSHYGSIITNHSMIEHYLSLVE